MSLYPFKSNICQQWFEFTYLIIVLFICCSVLVLLAMNWPIELASDVKNMVYSIIGGVLGGWSLDAKWFYRSTAMGRDNQYIPWKWQDNKLFWRLLVPLIAGVVAAAFFCLITSGVLTFLKADNIMPRYAFGISFVLGYFSDSTVAKMAELVKTLFGEPQKVAIDDGKGDKGGNGGDNREDGKPVGCNDQGKPR